MSFLRGKKVGIIDYRTGNISSLVKAFSFIGVQCIIISHPRQFNDVDFIIMPGIGHFGTAIESLNSSGLIDGLISSIDNGIPVLGICLGFQLLTRLSAESPSHAGLGILPLSTNLIQPVNNITFKVPHLGWNSIYCKSNPPSLLNGIRQEFQLFYFANSYAVPNSSEFNGNVAFYDHSDPFLAVAQLNNVCGVQFHPEKSRTQGLRLLSNFLEISQ